MSRVLIVDVDADNREAMERALAGAGHAVTAAPSGALALGVLEQERPDLVVTQAWVGDMDGCRLLALARRRPRALGVPFLLLAGGDGDVAAAAAAVGVDMVCTGHVSLATLSRRVAELLGGPPAETATAAAVAPGGHSPEADVAVEMPAFQGSLGVMDLPAITQAMALGGKSGCLELSLTVGAGCIAFERGKPIHAEFAGGQGEAAFAALVWASQAEGGTFRFVPAAGEPAASRTIHRNVEGLLLDVAAWLDEEGLGHAAPALSGGGARTGERG